MVIFRFQQRLFLIFLQWLFSGFQQTIIFRFLANDYFQVFSKGYFQVVGNGYFQVVGNGYFQVVYIHSVQQVFISTGKNSWTTGPLVWKEKAANFTLSPPCRTGVTLYALHAYLRQRPWPYRPWKLGGKPGVSPETPILGTHPVSWLERKVYSCFYKTIWLVFRFLTKLEVFDKSKDLALGS